MAKTMINLNLINYFLPYIMDKLYKFQEINMDKTQKKWSINSELKFV